MLLQNDQTFCQNIGLCLNQDMIPIIQSSVGLDTTIFAFFTNQKAGAIFRPPVTKVANDAHRWRNCFQRLLTASVHLYYTPIIHEIHPKNLICDYFILDRPCDRINDLAQSSSLLCHAPQAHGPSSMSHGSEQALYLFGQ